MYRHKVQYYETDKMGITHHSNYVKFMEEARMYFLDNNGFPYVDMEKQGIISPLTEITCEYKKPSTYGDIIDIEVYVDDLTAYRVKIGFIMKVRGETVCTGTSTNCFIDKNGKLKALKVIYPKLYDLFYKIKNEYISNKTTY